MNRPAISVIMPVYNAEKYVESAINSVLEQTFDDFEIICVNDCSKDNSLEILQTFAEKDSRIVVVDSPQNLGAGEARNLGLEKATGTYIAFIDADDTIESDLYEKAFALAESCGADQITWGLTEEYYDKNDKYIRSVPILPKREVCHTQSESMDMLLELERTTLFGYQWNSFFRSDIIKNNHIRFERSLFYEDFFFNLAFAKHGKIFATLDHCGYHYFKRINNSITNQFSIDYFPLSYRRVADLYKFFKENEYLNHAVYGVLGDKLLRYTLSAICRNFDPKAQMSTADRKNWFAACCNMPLYGEILPQCDPSHPAYGILKFAIGKKNFTVANALGKVISILR